MMTFSGLLLGVVEEARSAEEDFLLSAGAKELRESQSAPRAVSIAKLHYMQWRS